ncbi:MAG: glutamate dehydrogenase, partial [Chloroflexi bacterium]|nr:glutamate dehydrogenase [Chloroflexota bacterium]
VKGGVHSSKGLDIGNAREFYRAHGTVAGFPGTEPITNDDLLTIKCDILIPAAIESVIRSGNARKVKAKIVVEGANAPVTYEADQILNDRGIVVVPDILANAGGVIVSYFEWAQNIQEFRWNETRVNEELRGFMTRSYRAVTETMQGKKLTQRAAAYMIAVSRVEQATQLRGFLG